MDSWRHNEPKYEHDAQVLLVQRRVGHVIKRIRPECCDFATFFEVKFFSARNHILAVGAHFKIFPSLSQKLN